MAFRLFQPVNGAPKTILNLRAHAALVFVSADSARHSTVLLELHFPDAVVFPGKPQCISRNDFFTI